MTIREIQRSDEERLIDLWTVCDLIRPWNDPYQDIERCLINRTSSILLGFMDDLLVASVMVGHDGHRGWIYYLAVNPDFQGRGYGKQIVSAAEEWLKGENAIKLMLMVRKSNHLAPGFYEKIGFTESEVISFEKWLTKDGKRPG